MYEEFFFFFFLGIFLVLVVNDLENDGIVLPCLIILSLKSTELYR